MPRLKKNKKDEVLGGDAALERDMHRAFLIGVVLKGLNAVIEVVLGALLLYTHVVTDVILTMLDNALIEDPNNFFATHLYRYADITPHAQIFGGLYLLSHGVVKVFLVTGLLRNKLWAYPASIAVLLMFVFYQILRFIETYSVAMFLLTVFDMALIFLIWHEYQRMRQSAPKV